MLVRKRVRFLQEGEILGDAVFTTKGVVLIKAGEALTKEMLSRIRSFSINDVLIDDRFLDEDHREKELRKRFAEEHKQDLATVKNNLVGIVAGESKDCTFLNSIINRILDKVCLDKDIVMQLIYRDVKEEDYIYKHSLNVCNLAAVICSALDFRLSEIDLVTTAALLHDVGMIPIRGMWDHKDKLDQKAFAEIKKHPKIGKELLEKVEGLDPRVAELVYQHHERMDGSGYPRGLFGVKINRYARVLAIADSYAALIAGRKFRLELSPRQAMKLVIGEGQEIFDADILRAFLSSMAFYPIGAIVQLSNGEYGQVVGVNFNLPFRPHLKVYYDKEKVKYEKPIRIDLAAKKNAMILIMDILDKNELDLEFDGFI